MRRTNERCTRWPLTIERQSPNPVVESPLVWLWPARRWRQMQTACYLFKLYSALQYGHFAQPVFSIGK
jgi:hypothetical protein